MSAKNAADNSYADSSILRILHKCNAFRSQPAAVLIVTTMAVFADTVVYGIIVPFLPDILQDRLEMSSSANGLMFGCFGIGVLIGAPASAYISDRWRIHKWPMIAGLLCLGATSVLLALSNAYWELIVARLAQGISSGVTWSIGLAMIADVYTGESLGWAMGIAFSGCTLGNLGGPVLGGAIYSAGGVHAIAIFVGVITAVDLLFLLLLIEPSQSKSASLSRTGSSTDLESCLHEKPSATDSISVSTRHTTDTTSSQAIMSSSAPDISPGADCQSPITSASESAERESSNCPYAFPPAPAPANSMLTGDAGNDTASIHSDNGNAVPADAIAKKRTTMWDLLKEWPILACCLATITTYGVSSSFEPTLPIYMRDKYNSSTIVISLVFIAIVVPNVIISPIAGKHSSNRHTLSKIAPYGWFGFIIGGSILQAIAIVCLGATANIAGLVVNLAFVGLAGGIAAVPILSTMGEHVERMGGDAYAKVYALYNIAFSVSSIIVPTIMPPIMNAVGFAATMGIIASILVVGAIILAIQPTLMLSKHGRAAYVGENALPFL